MIENKLVVTSGPSHGQAFTLSQGRTTIGSASHNDVLLEDEQVSGFHAEIRIEDDAFFIADFNSEMGTFLNGRRVNKEVRMRAGDQVRMGSVQTVFVPRDGILVRKNEAIEIADDGLKDVATCKPKKWLFTACAVVLMLCVVKMMLANNSNQTADSKQDAHGLSASRTTTEAANGKARRFSVGASPDGAGSKNGGPAAGTGRHVIALKKGGKQDKVSNVYFDIAKKFADHQLWKEALAYYSRISDQNPDYPKLREQIAGMQFEIDNQIAFEQGRSHIKDGRYDRGADILKTIKENSYYHPMAAKVIAEVGKK